MGAVGLAEAGGQVFFPEVPLHLQEGEDLVLFGALDDLTDLADDAGVEVDVVELHHVSPLKNDGPERHLLEERACAIGLAFVQQQLQPQLVGPDLLNVELVVGLLVYDDILGGRRLAPLGCGHAPSCNYNTAAVN